MPPKTKKVGKYEIGQTLGEGTFGKVKYAVNTETQEAVAIKVLDKEKIQQQNMGNQIKKEISIMKVVRHPNIVQLIEVLASRTKIFIVLELVTGGELFDQIVKESRFTEDKARKYFRQLIHGLEYCNTKGVCHRDLKPENLLLDQNANLKISDFGLSALYTGGDEGGENANRTLLLHTTCGTPNYVAPEVLEDKGYDGKKADIWSVGVILYVLLAGFLPFDEKIMSDLFRKIQAAEVQYPAWFSDEVRDLMGKILVADPNVRVTISDIKEHPWYSKNGTLTTEHILGEGEDEANGGDSGADSSAGPSGVASPPSATPPSISDDRAQETIIRTQSEAGVKKIFQFKTTGDEGSIVERLSVSLVEMECELKVTGPKIKACKMTGSGMIGVIVQVVKLEGDSNMVEVRRGKGDIMEYSKFYKELVQNKIKDMIGEVVEEVVPQAELGGDDDE
ncbi:hypothetical protein TrST_g4613 [Triparma strigata]|uniref:non-specific serine/threonine protein kinase n=1 Tax=Triparma strigata TaxID=1606541 RepID=A0A9W6ZF96_9STRA|nr:hypothetical protein TrST_g4613 [Triparma strigata]